MKKHYANWSNIPVPFQKFSEIQIENQIYRVLLFKTEQGYKVETAEKVFDVVENEKSERVPV